MDADVLVAGAGPVGLFLAAELASGGARVVVLERLAEPVTAPKARGVGALATEALVRRGLGDELAAAHARGLRDITRDHDSTRGHFASIRKLDPDPARAGTWIWQPELEALLAGHAQRLGVRIVRGCEVTAVEAGTESDVDGVAVAAGGASWRAGWLAGCDGGRSTVRRLAGFAFPGTDAALRTTAGRVRVAGSGGLPAAGRYPGGVFQHGSADGGSFQLAGVTEPAAGTTPASGPVTTGELGAAIRRITGAPVRLAEVRDSRRFGDAARQAPEYRRERVLLAGDAAHVHSPSGGQGLNLGLLDAANLGWKLAAVLRGDLPESLLDSYTAERHPAGAAVLRNTLAQSALQAPGPQVDALREIVAEVLDLPAANRFFTDLLSGVRTRCPLPYPVNGLPDGVGGYPPDLEIAVDGGTRRLSELDRAGRGLLVLAHGLAGLAGPARDRVPVVHAGPAGGWCGLLLRPDGLLAWAAETVATADASALDTAIRAWFG